MLAAPWAHPRWYPASMEPAVLDRPTRSALVASRLRDLSADICCLQETTSPDLDVFRAALGPDYECHFVSNDPELWRNWLDGGDSWEPNGTAILWRGRRGRRRVRLRHSHE